MDCRAGPMESVGLGGIMDKKNCNALMFKGISQYNALRNYIEEIEIGFRLAGYNTCIIDGLEKSLMFQLEELKNSIPIDIIFTCNVMMANELRNYFPDAYYVTYLTDHPAAHRERLDTLDERSIVFTCDRSYEAYIRRYFSNIKYVRYIPLSGQAISRNIPYQKRSRNIIFTGSYTNPEHMYEKVFKCVEHLDELAEYMVENIIENPEQNLEMCLYNALQHFNMTISDQEFHELFCKVVWVGMYARSYYRDKMIRSLATNGLKVHVFGNGWESFEGDGKENIIIEKGNDYVARKAVADAKVSINIMPWFKEGFQERIAAAMLSGTVAVTDGSAYIKEQFTDGKEMVLYSLEHLEALPVKVKWLLEHSEDAERIAHSGRIRAVNELTWQHRTVEMVHYIQECTSLFPTCEGLYGKILLIPYRTLHNRQLFLDMINHMYEIMDMVAQVKMYDRLEPYDIEYFYSKFLFYFVQTNANYPEIQFSNVVYDTLMNVAETQVDAAAELLNLECMHILAVLLSRENQELRKEKESLQAQITSANAKSMSCFYGKRRDGCGYLAIEELKKL